MKCRYLLEKYKYIIATEKIVSLYPDIFTDLGSCDDVLQLLVNANNVFIEDVPFKIFYENKDSLEKESTIIKFIDATIGNGLDYDAFYENFDFDKHSKFLYKIIEYGDAKSTGRVFDMLAAYEANNGRHELAYELIKKVLSSNNKKAIISALGNISGGKLIDKNNIINLINIGNNYQLLLNCDYVIEDYVHPPIFTDVEMIIKWVDEGYTFSENFNRYVDEKIIKDKKLALAFAKKSIFVRGQYVDEDVLENYENLPLVLKYNHRHLLKHVYKYKKSNNKIKLGYLLYLVKECKNIDNKLTKDVMMTFIKTYDFSDDDANVKILCLLCRNKHYDLVEDVAKKMPYISNSFTDIDEKYMCLDKFPFLIWTNYRVSFVHKKYYERELCYKYKIGEDKKYVIHNISIDVDRLFILKNFYKHQKILYHVFCLDIDNDDAEHFLRSVVKDSIKTFIVDNICKNVHRYYDIITCIINFKWTDTLVRISNIKFIFL